MKTHLNRVESAVLLMADSTGRISVNAASAVEMEEQVAVLLRLQRKKLIAREPGAPYYSAFNLTDEGWDCVRSLRKSDEGFALPEGEPSY